MTRQMPPQKDQTDTYRHRHRERERERERERGRERERRERGEGGEGRGAPGPIEASPAIFQLGSQLPVVASRVYIHAPVVA
jgi:hypothetical protein